MAKEKKKVLIVSYYWPPSGGAGVQRWLKFVKYLKDFGWEPIVYTPKNNEIPVYDESLVKDIPEDITILKKDIWEPYTFYKKFIGARKDEKFNIGGFISENKSYGLKDKISTFIRGNFFIPDARKFWIKPSVKFLKKYLKDNPVDIIVTTGPPHSLHLIGLKLKRKLNLPWIADFRDPWTRMFTYKDLMLTHWADKKNKKLEKKVLENANHILTVGWTLKESLKDLGANNLSVITNGYDDDDFKNVEVKESQSFCITHTGNISRSKNSEIFWIAVSELLNEDKTLMKNLEIRLSGKLDHTVSQHIKKYQLERYVNKLGYLNHDQVILEQKGAKLLLLLTSDNIYSKGAVPGRLFEYLAAQRPIIAIAHPESDLAKVLEESEAGITINFKDKDKLKKSIKSLYRDYLNDSLRLKSEKSEKYSRKFLTQKLADLLNENI